MAACRGSIAAGPPTRSPVRSSTAGPLVGVVTFGLIFTVLRVLEGDAWPGELLWSGALLAAGLVTPRTRVRRQAAARDLVLRPGDLPTPWDQRAAWVYRDRITARSLLPTIAAAGLAVTAAALVSALMAAPRGTGLLVLCLCSAAGAGAAARTASRWRRLVPSRPAQPARRAVVAGPQARASVWCWASLAFLTGVAGPGMRPGSTGSVLVLAAALVVVPTLVVGAVLTRRGPDDVAVVDVARVATVGPLTVDALQHGFVPARSDEPGAAPPLG